MEAVSCPACGVLSVAGARYCHECGAQLDIDVFDLSDRTPEPGAPPPVPPGPGQRIGVALGAVGLLALVWFALFGGDSDTPEAEAPAAVPAETPVAAESLPPTPSIEFSEGPGAPIPNQVFIDGPGAPIPNQGFTVGPAAPIPSPFIDGPATIAGSLRWQQTDLGPDGWPIGLVEWGEQIFLFTALADAPSFEPFGRGMAGWVTDDGTNWQPLGTVIDELQAVQRVQATPAFLLASGSNTEGHPTVWTSANGVDWESTALPGGERLPSSTRLFTEAIGANDDSAVVVGTLHTVVSIDGQDQLARLDQPLAGVHVWSSRDGVGWRESVIHGQSVGSLSTIPSGELLMTGFDESVPISWRSDDGVTWDRTGSEGRFERMAAWGDALLGLGRSGRGADISISVDGIQWQQLGLARLLSDDLSWSFDQVATGEAGIAVVVTGSANRVAASTVEQFTVRSEVLEIIAARHETGVLLSVQVADSRGRLLMDEIPKNMEVDFSARTITFVEPDTRAEIFTLRALDTEQPETENSVPNVSRLLLFSEDGQQWSIQPIEVSDDALDVVQLLVTQSQTVAVFGRFDEGDGGNVELSGVQVWTADIG